MIAPGRRVMKPVPPHWAQVTLVHDFCQTASGVSANSHVQTFRLRPPRIGGCCAGRAAHICAGRAAWNAPDASRNRVRAPSLQRDAVGNRPPRLPPGGTPRPPSHIRSRCDALRQRSLSMCRLGPRGSSGRRRRRHDRERPGRRAERAARRSARSRPRAPHRRVEGLQLNHTVVHRDALPVLASTVARSAVHRAIHASRVACDAADRRLRGRNARGWVAAVPRHAVGIRRARQAVAAILRAVAARLAVLARSVATLRRAGRRNPAGRRCTSRPHRTVRPRTPAWR